MNITALSLEQQALVKEAADSWYRQTAGCVKFEYTDVGGVQVLRMDPLNKYDSDNTYTYGMYTPAGTEAKWLLRKGPIIELAFGRFQVYDIAIVVAAHELGHSLGLSHVLDPNALMSWRINSSHLALSKSDKIEIAKRGACNLLAGDE